jgi:hypothetical protein
MSAIITVKGHIFFPVNQMLLRAIYIGAVILNFIIPLAGICMLSGFIENQAVLKWSRAGPVLDKITPLSAHATPKKAIHIYIYIYTVPDSHQSHSHRCKRRKQAFAQANKYQTVGRIFGGNF